MHFQFNISSSEIRCSLAGSMAWPEFRKKYLEYSRSAKAQGPMSGINTRCGLSRPILCHPRSVM